MSFAERLRGLAILLLALPSLAGCTQPRGTHQKARVLDHGGKPCFAVADTAEARDNPPNLTGISLYARDDDGSRVIWHLEFRAGKTVLSPDDCLPYGAREDSSTGNLVPPLRSDVRYSVTINSDIPAGKDEDGEGAWKNRVYTADFCLVADPGSDQPSIHQVSRNESGRRDWSPCFSAEEFDATP